MTATKTTARWVLGLCSASLLLGAVAGFADDKAGAVTSDVPAGDEPFAVPDTSYTCQPVSHAASAFLREISGNIKSKKREQARIDEKKLGLEQLKQDLVAETKRLEEKIAAWDKRMADVKAREDAAEARRRAESEEEGKKKLAKAISKMPARSAATVLAGLDPPLAANLLRRMPPQRAGDTLAAMDPTRAARLTTTAIVGPTP